MHGEERRGGLVWGWKMTTFWKTAPLPLWSDLWLRRFARISFQTDIKFIVSAGVDVSDVTDKPSMQPYFRVKNEKWAFWVSFCHFESVCFCFWKHPSGVPRVRWLDMISQGLKSCNVTLSPTPFPWEQTGEHSWCDTPRMMGLKKKKALICPQYWWEHAPATSGADF